MGRGWWKIPAQKPRERECQRQLDVDLEVTLTSLSVVSHSLQQSQLCCPPHLQVGPSWDLFCGQPAFPVGRREQQSWGGVVRSGNGGIVVGWLLCLVPVLAPDVVQENTRL